VSPLECRSLACCHPFLLCCGFFQAVLPMLWRLECRSCSRAACLSSHWGCIDNGGVKREEFLVDNMPLAIVSF